jgi:muconolactone delta-isomerase
MLFLNILRAYMPLPIPLAEWAELAVKHRDYLRRLEKAGKIKFTAAFLGKRARVIIFDVESDEELFECINADPLFNYMEREVIPLISNEKVYSIYEAIEESSTKKHSAK